MQKWLFFEKKEKMRKLNTEISKIKVKLENANRWTHSSRIVNKLRDRVHNEKADIGFYKENIISEDLCYICGKIDHPTTERPVSSDFRKRNTKFSNGNKFMYIGRNRSTNRLPRWVKRNLIHPFDHKKGHKLVWVPKTNL